MGFNGGGFGGRPLNTGNMFITLKPLAERKISADQVIGTAARQLARIPAVTLYLQPVQDLRVGGRASNAQYQYTLAERQRERSARLGAAHAPETQDSARIARREQRPTK